VRAFWAAVLFFVLTFDSCKRAEPACAQISDMRVCEKTAGCSVRRAFVVALPDAAHPPPHDQYDCIPSAR
jgi:hypothetical protein